MLHPDTRPRVAGKEQAMLRRFEHLTSACAALLTSLVFVGAALPF